MELIVACVYCAVNRFISMSEYCYTDVMASLLVLPSSPTEIARKHFWVEVKKYEDW